MKNRICFCIEFYVDAIISENFNNKGGGGQYTFFNQCHELAIAGFRWLAVNDLYSNMVFMANCFLLLANKWSQIDVTTNTGKVLNKIMLLIKSDQCLGHLKGLIILKIYPKINSLANTAICVELECVISHPKPLWKWDNIIINV